MRERAHFQTTDEALDPWAGTKSGKSGDADAIDLTSSGTEHLLSLSLSLSLSLF